MKSRLRTMHLLIMIFSFFILGACKDPIERSGVVIDRNTKEPIPSVSIDIYMKTQKRDSLREDVVTDKNGHFKISEKRDRDMLFQLRKNGYFGFVNSLSVANDTIMMEREK